VYYILACVAVYVENFALKKGLAHPL